MHGRSSAVSRDRQRALALYPDPQSPPDAADDETKVPRGYPSLECLHEIDLQRSDSEGSIACTSNHILPRPIDCTKLEHLVRDLAAAGPLPPYRPPQPPIAIRRWAPSNSPGQKLGKIVAARRELGIRQIRELPAPKVSRNGQEGWRGRTHSFKGGLLPWKGRLVDAAIREFDVDPDVSRVVMRPLTLRYRSGNGWRDYSPHLLAVRAGMPWLITCTWEQTASNQVREQDWCDFGVAAADLGLGFEVLTERYLEREPRQSNVEDIWRARFARPPSDELADRAATAVAGGTYTITTLGEALNVARRVVLTLLLYGPLRVDLDVDLASAPIALRVVREDLQ